MPLQKRMPDAVKKWTSWLSYGPPSEGPKLPSAIKHIPKDGPSANWDYIPLGNYFFVHIKPKRKLNILFLLRF